MLFAEQHSLYTHIPVSSGAESTSYNFVQLPRPNSVVLIHGLYILFDVCWFLRHLPVLYQSNSSCSRSFVSSSTAFLRLIKSSSTSLSSIKSSSTKSSSAFISFRLTIVDPSLSSTRFSSSSLFVVGFSSTFLSLSSRSISSPDMPSSSPPSFSSHALPAYAFSSIFVINSAICVPPVFNSSLSIIPSKAAVSLSHFSSYTS
ncbi:hypothetical protein BZA05DRAFT_400120 [Tricharina praecox]|uniref:uncharacterized protein n=1 Tax=Tricharina praecox TaxID=43433 RepID=UPI00221E6064|nr:uncharacterized protein BZA05DRAFT_400120 [Tricharina praecox]KAI5850732.1 hypothetical protein BZA05DRAFT_400120 [Tricharina praecox]